MFNILFPIMRNSDMLLIYNSNCYNKKSLQMKESTLKIAYVLSKSHNS